MVGMPLPSGIADGDLIRMHVGAVFDAFVSGCHMEVGLCTTVVVHKEEVTSHGTSRHCRERAREVVRPPNLHLVLARQSFARW